MLLNRKKNLVLAAVLLLVPGCIFAADTTSKPDNMIGGYNLLLLTLVGLMLILLYFIGMLANTTKAPRRVAKPPKTSIHMVAHARRYGAGTPIVCRMLTKSPPPRRILAKPWSMKP